MRVSNGINSNAITLITERHESGLFFIFETNYNTYILTRSIEEICIIKIVKKQMYRYPKKLMKV